jgi:hypothetical protein
MSISCLYQRDYRKTGYVGDGGGDGGGYSYSYGGGGIAYFFIVCLLLSTTGERHNTRFGSIQNTRFIKITDI